MSARLLITGGTVVDGTGAPGYAGTVAVTDEGRLRVVAAGSDAEAKLEAERRGADDRGGGEGRRARASSTCTATRGSWSWPSRVTSPRSARASRPRSSAWTATPTRHSRSTRTCSTSSSSTAASMARPDDTVDLRLGHGRELPHPVRRDDERQHRVPRRELAAPHRRPRLGRHAGRRQGDRARCGRCCARRWRRGRSGSAPGSTIRRAPTRRRPSSRHSPTRPARLGGIYHTHVRYALGDRFLDPFREAIEIGRRGEAPAHITHFYHRIDVRGDARTRCSRSSTTRAPRGSTSRSTPIRTSGRARGSSSSCRSGSRRAAPTGRRSASADPAVRAAHPRGAAGAGHDVRRPGRAPGHPARLLRAAGAPALGRLDDRRGPGRDRRRAGRPPVRPPHLGGPAGQRGDARSAPRGHPPVLPPHGRRWSARTASSSATGRARGRTAASRASSASSSGTSGSSGSRRRCTR